MTADAKGLLIDYGGVLTNPLAPVLADFCRARGLAEDAIVALNAAGSPFRDEFEAYERGKYREDEFFPKLAHALGLAVAEVTDFLAGVQPHEPMFRVVESIRAQGIRTCLVSNSWGVSTYSHTRLTRAFDGIVISGQVGMRKPEPGIYVHAARVIGVRPQDCVFVDDTATNLFPAVAIGMSVVHHQAAAQTRRELERLFDITIEAGD